MIYLLISIAIALFSSNAYSWDAKVTKVHKSNHITVKIKNKTLAEIYLYGINANNNKNSILKLNELILNKDVDIKNIDLDNKHGHINSIVYINGTSVNEELIRSGLATVNEDKCIEDFCTEWISFQNKENDKSTKTSNKTTSLYIGDYDTSTFHTMLCDKLDNVNNFIILTSRQNARDKRFIPCKYCSKSTALKDGSYYVLSSPKRTHSQHINHNIFQTNTETFALRLESEIKNLEKNRRMNEINDPFSGVNIEIGSKRKQLTEIRKAQALSGN